MKRISTRRPISRITPSDITRSGAETIGMKQARQIFEIDKLQKELAAMHKDDIFVSGKRVLLRRKAKWLSILKTNPPKSSSLSSQLGT